jgi:hypothetical protein
VFLCISAGVLHAREMTECGKNGYKCKNNIRRKYKNLYDKNRQEKLAEIKRELSKPVFLRNKTNQFLLRNSSVDLQIKILSLTLINPCIILIVVVNKVCVSLYFCWRIT